MNIVYYRQGTVPELLARVSDVSTVPRQGDFVVLPPTAQPGKPVGFKVATVLWFNQGGRQTADGVLELELEYAAVILVPAPNSP